MTGITVKLYARTLSGYDSLNNPVYTTAAVNVDNVLVGQPTADEITSGIDLYGKKAEYMLGIPKGDAHEWRDCEVEFFGRRFRAYGDVLEGIAANVPTPWHRKVMVERCE